MPKPNRRLSGETGSTPAAPEPKVLVADHGCDADAIDSDIEARGNRRIQIAHDGFIHAQSNLIERGIGPLTEARRVATRYDETAASYLGFVQLVAIRLCLGHLVNSA